MLSLNKVTNSDQAGQYYEKDDYYTQGKEGQGGPSEWQGQGAEALGLNGEVAIEEFKQILDGNLPNGDKIQVASKGHLPGVDLTFSAPKSVSMQALIGKDHRLIQAHNEAVQKTLKYAEGLITCRQTKDGKSERVTTNSMVAATFRHELSRACDPQLHTHCVVLNVTQRADGKWRAMDNRAFFKQQMLMGAMYRAELAREVQQYGYQIRVTGEDGCFELAKFSDEHIKKYSERTQVIEEVLAKDGKTREEATAREKEIITLATRPKKTEVDREKLFEYWQEKSESAQIDYSIPEPKWEWVPADRPAAQAVRYAMEHLTERQSVIQAKDLVKEALTSGIGQTVHHEIEKEIAYRIKQGELIQSEDRYTTYEAQKREREILNLEKEGRNQTKPILEKEDLSNKLQAKGLNSGQQEAASLILSSKNQFVGVQGLAGTGKTYMLTAAREHAEEQGYKMFGLAPSVAAARELEATGMESRTLAAFEHDTKFSLPKKSVLVVDEAGMVSTKQIEKVFKRAEKNQAKVILVGDTQQLKAVEAGKPFAQLQEHGMATAGMSEIQRQKDPELKQAVELASRGKVASSLQLMDSSITEISNHGKRYAAMAQDYVKLSPEERQGTLIVSGTNKARKAINQEVRQALGFKEEDGFQVDILEQKKFTKAQIKQIKNYQPGYQVKPDRDYRSLGVKKGELCQVRKLTPDHIMIKRADGLVVAWDPSRLSKFSVYELDQREIALGDRIRITENHRGKGLINGDFTQVTKIEEGRIHLQRNDGKEFKLDTKEPLNIDHGYCSTVHAAQGKTCHRVLIDAPTKSPTSVEDNYYVALSRAKYHAKIYTDERDKVVKAMSRVNLKPAALEVHLNKDRLIKKQQAWRETSKPAFQPGLGKSKKSVDQGRELER